MIQVMSSTLNTHRLSTGSMERAIRNELVSAVPLVLEMADATDQGI